MASSVITTVAPLQSADLSIIALQDPGRIEFLLNNLADQINQARMAASPPKQCIDLSAHIADVIIETTAQGAATLEVHVLDPDWVLLRRDEKGVSFIDVDDQGYLWPPIEVNFPSDASDATWRLCACNPSSDLGQANIVLTFEDKIVSELREHAGPVKSNPNETRAEFIRRLVDMANKRPKIQSDVSIRFVPLLPASVFTKADLAASQVTPPKSQTSGGRKNPGKNPGPTPSGPSDPIASQLNGPSLSIGAGLIGIAGAL